MQQSYEIAAFYRQPFIGFQGFVFSGQERYSWRYSWEAQMPDSSEQKPQENNTWKSPAVISNKLHSLNLLQPFKFYITTF